MVFYSLKKQNILKNKIIINWQVSKIITIKIKKLYLNYVQRRDYLKIEISLFFIVKMVKICLILQKKSVP
ncbi:hypothetical protein BN181_1890011 [Clostridioides difficile T17]|nr:hypothetical protein BN181_1890011 [Clostridioides difficile T17]